MIEGTVNDYLEAVVRLSLRGPTGQVRDVDAVIDTGFSGYLTLPPTIAEELRLPFLSLGHAILANGEEETFNVYSVAVVWDGAAKFLEAGAMGLDLLIGMALLEAHSLHIEVADGGTVVIQAMT